MAVQAGDAKTALEAVDQIARKYQIDAAAMRAETLLSAAANARLADAWWDLAQKRTGPEKESFLLRAGYWYQKAEATLTSGLAKVKVRKRLEEIAKLGRPIQEASSGPPLAIAPFDAKQARILQLRWSKHLRTPVMKTNSIGMKLVLIPPGEFEMGSTEEEVARLLEDAKRRNAGAWDLEAIASEAPKHRVKITKAFYLGICEVTQAEFERVIGNNPSRFRGDPNHPVEQAYPSEVAEFCRRLSELPDEKAAGAVYRLPTEAEWEYACRAGTTSRYSFGDAPTNLSQYAWWSGNAQGRTHPVGRLRPNAWGLFDVHGNLWEWCADWFAVDYYVKSPTDDPLGPDSGVRRVLRGGSWDKDSPDYFRCAVRDRAHPRYRAHRFGFRVAMTLAP